MKTIILSLFLLLAIRVSPSIAQSTVMEISWTDVEYTNYKGLLVLYPNNQGFLKVKFYNNDVGTVWVYQSALLTCQYDYMGNCTSYINCSYPQADPYVPYAADNFIIFPNGNMYTQDYSGKWSTYISAVLIQPVYWTNKFKEYKI